MLSSDRTTADRPPDLSGVSCGRPIAGTPDGGDAAAMPFTPDQPEAATPATANGRIEDEQAPASPAGETIFRAPDRTTAPGPLVLPIARWR